MRKTWVYQRHGVKGWWVYWIDDQGKQRCKCFPTKYLASHYHKILYQQLNSDVFIGHIKADWQTMYDEYKHSKVVAGLTDTSIYEAMNTLRHWKEIIGSTNSKQFTQKSVDKFVLHRLKTVSRYTVNKEISNLRAFYRWCRKKRYIIIEIEFMKVKVQQPEIVVLSNEQIRNLLISARQRSEAWMIRVLLALSTGLRRNDIEAIQIVDIHVDRNTIATRSKKTGKAMGERPVPTTTMTVLIRYLESVIVGQMALFSDTHCHPHWKIIRDEAGLCSLKFHDLRKTFASTLARKGVSSTVTQKLLEHSSAQLTYDIYTNVDPELAKAVDLLPVDQWV